MFPRLSLIVACWFLLPGISAAQTLKPLPLPDLSGLTPAQNADVREARANFERESSRLSGLQLAEQYADIGGFYARARLYAAAEVAFQNAALIVPQDDRWVYLLGVLARTQDRAADARRLFDRAFKLNSMYLPTRMALVGELIRAGEMDRAHQLLEEAAKTHPGQPAPLAVLADIAYRQQRFADAITHLEQAVRSDPQATALYAALARAQEGAGNAGAAREAGTKAGNVPPRLDDPLVQRILPVVEAAAPAAQAAPAERAPDPRQLIAGEVAMYLGAGRLDEARRTLDAGLKTFPNDALLLTGYVHVEVAAGNLAAARDRARDAVTGHPRSAQAWITQGLVLEIVNDDEGARSAYRKALEIEPRSTRAQLSLGNMALRNGRATEAVAAYRAATVIDADDDDAWARLLAAQFILGQCEAGVRDAQANAARKATDPLFAELFVRAASTCRAATAAQREKALVDGERLYKADNVNVAQASEAYALALAANARWDEATQTQGGAMFEAVRAGDQAVIAQYREFYQRFEARQVPDRPWPSSHWFLTPQRPAPPPAAAPAARPN